MKTIIAGGRDFQESWLVNQTIASLPWSISEVVCGEAKGADFEGKRWALKNNIPVKSFPANWKRFGRRAGHIRNAEMAGYAEAAIIFWNGFSEGTANMLDLANRHLKYVIVVNY